MRVFTGLCGSEHHFGMHIGGRSNRHRIDVISRQEAIRIGLETDPELAGPTLTAPGFFIPDGNHLRLLFVIDARGTLIGMYMPATQHGDPYHSPSLPI